PAPDRQAKHRKHTRTKRGETAGPRVRRQPPPTELSPQLATLVDRPPTGPGWSYEVKYDGYRILCRLEGKTVKLVSRNGNGWNDRMKGLARALSELALGDGW